MERSSRLVLGKARTDSLWATKNKSTTVIRGRFLSADPLFRDLSAKPAGLAPTAGYSYSPGRHPGARPCRGGTCGARNSTSSRALSERIPTGPTKESVSAPTDPSHTSALSAKTFISSPSITACKSCVSPERSTGTGVLRRALIFRYPRFPHSVLRCCPGLLFTETTSSDSGSIRHIA